IIRHGVLPPLRPRAKLPRFSTAALPAAAIISAPRAEAASPSAKTSSFGATAAASARLLVVAAELLAHRREHLVAEVAEPARVEALLQRRGQDRRRHPLVDRRDRGPATLAGVRDAAGEVGAVWRFPHPPSGQGGAP